MLTFWRKRMLVEPFHLTLSVCPREQKKGNDRAATLCLDLTSEYLQGFEHRSWGLFWEVTPDSSCRATGLRFVTSRRQYD